MDSRQILAADVFYNRTGRKHVYNITSIENVPSIIENGILCFNLAGKIPHNSIAIPAVQERREQVTIPNGLKLHSYANLYFDYNNPMLYSRKDVADNLCVLAVSSLILNDPRCIVSDRNAATALAKFYPAVDGVQQINFKKVLEQYWVHDDQFEYANHKAIKCAEILIPYSVSYEYVVEACVVNQKAKSTLLNAGFDKKITVKPSVFYEQGGAKR